MVIEIAHTNHLASWIAENKDIAIDIETSGLNPRKDKIMGIGLSNNKESFYIPVRDYVGGNLITVLDFNLIKNLLESLTNKRLRTWNGAFDLPFILNEFKVNLIDSLHIDGMLLKHTVDEEQPFALKEVASNVFGSDAKLEKEEVSKSIRKNGGSIKQFYKADLAILAKYCEKDCILTYNLIEYYLVKLKSQGLADFFFKDEVMPLYREVTIPMEQRGVRISTDLLIDCKINIQKDLQVLEKSIQSKIAPHLSLFENWFLNKDFPPSRSGAFAQGICKFYKVNLPKTDSGNYSLTAKNIENLPESLAKDILSKKTTIPNEDIYKIQKLLWEESSSGHMFNLLSKHHLKKLFFDTLKETAISYTDKGNPQVDDEFLTEMGKKYDWSRELISFNKLTKIKGTYIDRFLEEQEDGVFYPRFMQHRTVSGRYGSDLQQLPRPIQAQNENDVVAKYNNKIRQFFICRDGHKFIDADYESLEPHVFAHVSGDEGLKEIFRSGLDFYSTIAIKTEGITNASADKHSNLYLGKIDKQARQKAKAYSLGIPYGMSAYKLSFEIGADVEQCEQLIEDYFKSFPQLHEWFIKSRDFAKKYGYIKSEAGRIRHLQNAKSLYSTYGDSLENFLKLYTEFSSDSRQLERIKLKRREFLNYLNNSCNFQIQSLSASIVNRSALAINRFMKTNNIKGQVICQIHDQLILEVEERHCELMKQKMQEIMENTYRISLPLKAPAQVAKDFYEGH